MRYPGQRYDSATGLNYNYYRDYEPGTGRYVQSDPIGLAGGITTFSYVDGNPLVRSDPLGLVDHTSGRWIDCGKGCRIRIDFTYDSRTGTKKRHLHWECKGKEGECGEHGEPSHGGTWDDAPSFIKECARKNGFVGESTISSGAESRSYGGEMSPGARAVIWAGGIIIIIVGTLSGAGS